MSVSMGAGVGAGKCRGANANKIVAVLAVQGAFIEHERKLANLGARCVELRQAADLRQPFDALVLPGGESTVQGKLLRELDMLKPLRERIMGGMPVLATCAGLILLAQQVVQEDDAPPSGAGQGDGTSGGTSGNRPWQDGSMHEESLSSCSAPSPQSAPRLATLPVTVRRNAYGRQLASFRTEGELVGIGRAPFTFIRAPYIEQATPEVEVLARIDGHIVAVRHKNQLALAFHPELDEPNTIHQAFLEMIR